MTKKRQLSPAEQDLVDELEVGRLWKQIALLKRIPKDFRDMEVQGEDWRGFAEVMGSEKKVEMLKWAKGGVLCLEPINDLERKVLTVYGEIHELRELRNRPDFVLEDVLQAMRINNYSFVYASDWPKHVIVGMNWLAQHQGWKFRFKGQLLGDRGYPLGI